MYCIQRTWSIGSTVRLSLVKMGSGWSVDHLQSLVYGFSYGIRLAVYKLFRFSFQFIFHLLVISFLVNRWGIIWWFWSSNSWRCSWCVNTSSKFFPLKIYVYGCVYPWLNWCGIFVSSKLRIGSCTRVRKVWMLQQCCIIFRCDLGCTQSPI